MSSAYIITSISVYFLYFQSSMFQSRLGPIGCFCDCQTRFIQPSYLVICVGLWSTFICLIRTVVAISSRILIVRIIMIYYDFIFVLNLQQWLFADEVESVIRRFSVFVLNLYIFTNMMSSFVVFCPSLVRVRWPWWSPGRCAQYFVLASSIVQVYR